MKKIILFAVSAVFSFFLYSQTSVENKVENKDVNVESKTEIVKNESNKTVEINKEINVKNKNVEIEKDINITKDTINEKEYDKRFKKAKNKLEWIKKHPRRAEWLCEHPNVSEFLEKHPKIREYVLKHPELARKLYRNPKAMKYLEKHPKFRKRLEVAAEKYKNASPEEKAEMKEKIKEVRERHNARKMLRKADELEDRGNVRAAEKLRHNAERKIMKERIRRH